MVISTITDQAAAQDNGGLNVTSNAVQPIFKVEKVPSNSLGSHTGSEQEHQSQQGSGDNTSINLQLASAALNQKSNSNEI